jgi:hypothetical protein
MKITYDNETVDAQFVETKSAPDMSLAASVVAMAVPFVAFVGTWLTITHFEVKSEKAKLQKLLADKAREDSKGK